jgi:hypothetical protein
MSSGFPLATVTPPTLSNWQVSFNGLTIGVGTAYGLLQIEGFDLPPVANGDVARPRDTGEFIGLDFLRGRDITMTVDLTSSAAGVASAAQALATAFVPPSDGQTETPLWIQLPGLPLMCASVRVRKRSGIIDLAWSQGYVKASIIGMHATDPRVYAPTIGSTIDLASIVGGLTWPTSFPLTFGSSSGGGSLIVNNTGNMEMRPIITITGPVTNPVVENETLGEFLSFANTNVGYTLANGEQLVIDTDAHSVMFFPLDATIGASRRQWLQNGSTWWNLPPGTSSIVFSSGDSSLPSPVPTCEVTFAPAYSSVS